MAQTQAPKPLADPPKPAASIRAAMEESIARQRDSVKRQVKSSPADSSSWFTVPWNEEDAIQPIEPVKAPADGGQDPPPISTTAASFNLWTPHCPPVPPQLLNPHIDRAAALGGLSADLLHAVIQKESSFQPCAVSSKGALGLMQLMPATAAGLGVRNPFDPIDNLYGGARYLGNLLGRYDGNLNLALGAYNAGPAKVDSYGGVPPYPETQNFVRGVLSLLGLGGVSLDE
ncbi:MAG: lytic transglycosylase domain-containing protein [Acidimicrobiia bacterium]|nr:lytic transglycosylase domain-containing protein [Acidimicrobiia bacterium]